MAALILSAQYLASVHFDDGLAALNKTDFTAAIAHFNECLSYTPDDGLAHWYRSLSLLATGDYLEGMREQEWRWKICDWTWGLLDRSIDRIKALPPWTGESLAGKRLLIHYEQGFGDTIMMLRYLPVLQRMGAVLSAVMPPPLQRLLQQQFGIEVFGQVPYDLSQYDYRLGACGAMWPLRQTKETVPSDPYIFADCTLLMRPSRKIGICWSGRSRRELSLQKFLSLLDHDGYELYALQYGAEGEVRPLVASDFVDTSRNIVKMDHVVSIDTGLAHLAGAMGHPSTHVIVPHIQDWRWYHSKVWYPTMNVYRQPQAGDDWSEPFARINAAIAASNFGDPRDATSSRGIVGAEGAVCRM